LYGRLNLTRYPISVPCGGFEVKVQADGGVGQVDYLWRRSMTAGVDSSALSALIERRLYLHPVVLLTSFGRLNEFRGGRAPLRPAERSARACCVDRPPALFYSKLTHCPRI